ncbi:MAG: uracil-DNA glycosylase [Dethiobacter sp.]|jgi:DNA polymerase|nr:uracil-DNA glycosylase [Dethiobacter sp.]
MRTAEEIQSIDNLDDLKEICLTCQRCSLACTRRNVVFGEGASKAELFILAEAPGAKEDESGRPFVGRAGDLLTRLMSEAGIERKNVFITGSAKCRPPGNRNPRRSELAACRPFLDRQLAIIRPKVVVTLGLVAVHNILDPKARMADVRGRWFDGPFYKIYPTYHPAAVLRSTVRPEVLVKDFLACRL